MIIQPPKFIGGCIETYMNLKRVKHPKLKIWIVEDGVATKIVFGYISIEDFLMLILKRLRSSNEGRS